MFLQDWIKWMLFSRTSLQHWMSQFGRGDHVSYCLSHYRSFAETVQVEIRQKAIEAALSVVSGAYQTTLLSYFTHRDLFPSLMKVRTCALCYKLY
jgi:hypothetical protein